MTQQDHQVGKGPQSRGFHLLAMECPLRLSQLLIWVVATESQEYSLRQQSLPISLLPTVPGSRRDSLGDLLSRQG